MFRQILGSMCDTFSNNGCFYVTSDQPAAIMCFLDTDMAAKKMMSLTFSTNLFAVSEPRSLAVFAAELTC